MKITLDKKQIQAEIASQGCHLVHIEASGNIPAHVYTIGLFERFNHPEIICFGLSLEVMHLILKELTIKIEEGASMSINTKVEGVIENFPVQFLKVDSGFYQDYLNIGGWYYNNTYDFPVLQLVWCDKLMFFPWQEEFDSQYEFWQPLLDRNETFKFYESPKLGVFVTDQILKGGLIKSGFHDIDGDWLFIGSEEMDEHNVKTISFEQLLHIDPTINDLYDLPNGFGAFRETKEEAWDYYEDLDEEDIVEEEVEPNIEE